MLSSLGGGDAKLMLIERLEVRYWHLADIDTLTE